jgi:hypothetical protein
MRQEIHPENKQKLQGSGIRAKEKLPSPLDTVHEIAIKMSRNFENLEID